MRFFEIEVIATIHIDMPIAGRPDPGEITVLYRLALAFELLDHCGHIHRIGCWESNEPKTWLRTLVEV